MRALLYIAGLALALVGGFACVLDHVSTLACAVVVAGLVLALFTAPVTDRMR